MSKIYYGVEILNVDNLLSTVLNLGDMEHFGYSESVDQFLKYLYTLKIDKIEEFSRLVKNTIPNENIKIKDLENSYFIDHLKYIMMVIMSLIDDDIIKDDILINLDDELNIYNIYNIIKNIEFKKQKQKKK